MPRVELEQLDLAPQHLKLLRELLAQHLPDAEVWAYGSRVCGTGHEGSDLDLVLRHPDDLTQDLAGWYELQDALQESRLPILVEIHRWAHLPAAFHEEIERRYVVVQPVGQVSVA